jgi:signal transduction histidine kinase
VGLFYLDTRRHRLSCLNQTAKEFLREEIPVTADDLSRHALHTLSGQPVRPADLPLVQAWREGTVQEDTFVLTRPDGGIRHLSWSVSPLRRKDGAVRGLSATLVVSIPEPDWEELAGLAHDLRSPLQVLRLLVPVLEALPPNHPEATKVLGRIRSASDRGLELGLDLLNWCQQPLRGRPTERSWIPLEPFLQSMAAEHLPTAQRKGLPVVVEVGPAAGLDILTNRLRLGRLLGNLLTNAIRYTSEGEVRLEAKWREEAGKGRVMLLSVTDTGAGLDPEEQESIFQPFTRGRAGREGDSGGSGLGLAVVDRLIYDLGLALEVFSEQGLGSTFAVVVPLTLLRRPSNPHLRSEAGS